MDCRCPRHAELWDPLFLYLLSSLLLITLESPAPLTQNHPFPEVFWHCSCHLSLWILQVCRPLEYCQVYGWVLPRVWPGRQGREAFLVPSLLLQERPGPSQLSDQEGNSKTPGKSWAVVVLSVRNHHSPISHSSFLSCKLQRCS